MAACAHREPFELDSIDRADVQEEAVGDGDGVLVHVRRGLDLLGQIEEMALHEGVGAEVEVVEDARCFQHLDPQLVWLALEQLLPAQEDGSSSAIAVAKPVLVVLMHCAQLELEAGCPVVVRVRPVWHGLHLIVPA